ncbi:MAG: protein kinase, partial [Myxococcales bacterium]|nr:protein kinase [Myxococcales bacterium]
MNPALDKDRTQFGKYTLVERLGRGGMADVWKAKISGPGGFQRTLVIKRILPHLVEDEQFKSMFVAEARLSARLNHANIVQVFELGDVDGEFYLAMEYVRGR